MTTTAEAPSLVCEELPAVTLPRAWNAGRSFASASSDVSRRGPSSIATVISVAFGGPPFGVCTTRVVTGTISSAKRPASSAARARWWLRSAKASCSSREMPDSRAWFSATRPVLRYTSGYDSTSDGFGATVWPPIGTRLIDSVPPAMTTSAEPHMTRSDANAIAWRPEEQKRLIVTAEAETGIPARRLAIRATFNPCSASGIAQPMITSSTSAGAIAGARRSASPMAIAASSSGRVPRSTPLGAFPTGVRTAATITASVIVPQEVFNGVGDLPDLAVEQMVGCVDHDELLRLAGTRVELAHLFQRTNLVSLAVHEELRLLAVGARR